jgi:SAM-dependent methyltransferase
VRISHKVWKLAQPLTYRRAWRRVTRFAHPVPLAPIFDKIDQAKLAQLQARYSQSDAHYAKYADVRRWLDLNIVRAQDLNLHRSPPKSVLDLGCGGGFFLHVAQHLGHTGLGLDIDVFPLFGELLDLLQVKRTVWSISPFQSLPDLGRKFDLITAFSIDFNRNGKVEWWGPAEWKFLLDDLKKRLNPSGRVYLGMNPRQDGEYYTPELRDFFLEQGASVERERIDFAHFR